MTQQEQIKFPKYPLSLLHLNQERIATALAETKVSNPLVKEKTVPLVEYWLTNYSELDSLDLTIGVEMPWFLWLNEKTLLVGVMDRIAVDSKGVFGCEWKTTRGATLDRFGRPSKWWNEDVWFHEIMYGPQTRIYALAMREGSFVVPGATPDEKTLLRFGLMNESRIKVRAVTKTNPPECWPTCDSNGLFTFNERAHQYTTNALLNTSTAVLAQNTRQLSGRQIIPWMLPGTQCNQFGSKCPYYTLCCAGEHPTRRKEKEFPFSMDDPGSAAIQAALQVREYDRLPEDTVILSASLYSTYQQCAEKFRIVTQFAEDGGETSEAIDIGSCFHASIAEAYRQHKEWQEKGYPPLEEVLAWYNT